MYYSFIEYDEIIILKVNLELATKPRAISFKNYFEEILKKDKNVIVDCSSVVFMDSTFLGSIIYSIKTTKQRGLTLKFVFTDFDVPIWNIQSQNKMNKFVQIYSSVDEILQEENISEKLKQDLNKSVV